MSSAVVESLLAESDDEGFNDADLEGISIEDILREEEEATSGDSKIQVGGDRRRDDEFYAPAKFTVSLTPMKGMDVTKIGENDTTPSALTVLLDSARPRRFANSQEEKDDDEYAKSPLRVAEAREKQLLSCVDVELVSPLQMKRKLRVQSQKAQSKGKKKRKKKIALPTVSGEVQDDGSAKGSGVVKVEPMASISRQLKKNIEFKEDGPGSPTVVAIHSKFIAIGTSKGLVIVFDHFQNIRQVLGNANDADTDGSISAIDVSPGSDYLVSGFQSGRLVLWDMIKGTPLKAVGDAHESPVAHLRFLKDQKPVVMSVDANGIVNKVSFSKMMGMVYVVDVDAIYDGSAGKILSLSVLPQSAGNAKIAYLTDQYCLAALSSEKLTFIIAIEPEVRVLYRWQRPEDVSNEDPALPSVSFNWVSFPGSSRALAPILSRGWGNQVQFLELVFPGGQKHTHAKHGWPTFEEHFSLASDSALMAIQWLGDQVLVYLNGEDEVCFYDVLSRQQLEIVDVSSLELVFATYKGRTARSFANSFRGCDNILYLLGLKELQTARVQPWTQRIDAFVEEGEWLEALALALDHYEGLKAAAAERAVRDRFPPVFFRNKQHDQCLVDILHMSQTNQRTGEKEDVFRHEESADEVRWVCGEEPYPPDVAKLLEETLQKARSGQVTKNFVPISTTERVADLLMEYVRLAIANAPTDSKEGGKNEKAGVKLELEETHYQMLAGVCIEYCSIIGRTDLLFGEIFTRFRDANRLDMFVKLLEPYILSGKLTTLSKDALEALVSHYAKQDKLASVEQCLLQLNVSQLDVDATLELCMEHELFSALIYLYNSGLEDYVTPIDLLMEACTSESRKRKDKPEEAAKAEQSDSSSKRVNALAMQFGGGKTQVKTTKTSTLAQHEIRTGQSRRKYFGYKLLLYLSYALAGHTFPQREPIALNELHKVRSLICYHLFTKEVPGNEGVPFARLATLVDLDAKEFFNILAKLFDDPNVEFDGEQRHGSTSSSRTRYDSAREASIMKCPSRLSMMASMAVVVFGEGGPNDRSKSSFGALEHGQFFMFEARLLSGAAIDLEDYVRVRKQVDVTQESSGSMLDSLLAFLAQGPASLDDSHKEDESPETGMSKTDREALVVKLMGKVPRDAFDADLLLSHVVEQEMHQAAGTLYKERRDFSNAIKCYLADEDVEYKLRVFNYIRVETDKMVGPDEADTRKHMEEAILSHAPALMQTDGQAFVVLILGHFSNLNNKVIQKFVGMGKGGARLEFEYLKQVLEGCEKSEDSAEMVRELLDKSKLRMADDSAVQERFIKLLCDFEPARVLPYLESHNNYKVETCLKLCKDLNITDAQAYLLERTGDVNGALQLILKNLEHQLKKLKPALRGLPNNNDKLASAGVGLGMASLGRNQHGDSIVESTEEGRDVLQTTEVALAMCQRNSLRNRDNQAEKLWFTLLDKVLRMQASSRASSASTSQDKKKANRDRGAQTAFQVALNELIRFILERMASSVSLKSILYKITDEHGKDTFKDFRPTIFGMLDTYNYERNIYDTANGLISTDLYDQLVTLKKARAKTFGPPSNRCHYCEVQLTKAPFGMANTGADKWSLPMSTVLIVNGKTFHESCGTAYQQGMDSKTNQKKTPAAPQRRDSAAGGLSGSSSEPVAPADDDAAHRLQKKQPSTRRYLTRLKNARRADKKQVAPHVVLESLIREDTGRNRYLKSSRGVISMRPDPEIASKSVKKRIGSRKPNSLPSRPRQMGGI